MTMTNKAMIQRHFNRASAHYDRYAYIQREIGLRLLAHLDVMKLAPTRILDIGTSTGYIAQLLQGRYPDASVYGIDLAENLLQQAQRKSTSQSAATKIAYICADAEALPFPAQQFDCVVSNLTLQWCDIQRVFSEVQRILKPNGLWLFSTLGPDSLFELRRSWQDIDTAAHTLDFTDLHDIGDAIIKARFTEPVMEMEKITFHYASMAELLADIRGIGAQNIHPQQSQGLMGKQRWQTFLERFQQLFCRDTIYPLTYEIVYGHAWKPERDDTVASDEMGVAHFPLAYLRRPIS